MTNQKLTDTSEIISSLKTIQQQTISTINACTEEQYKHTDTHASIGAHTRHLIEFIKAMNTKTGHINYDDRLRKQRIEADQHYAIEQLNAEVTNLISTIQNRDLTEELTATMDGVSAKSTFGRELSSTLSHTIHHLAFIKILSAPHNIRLDESIGVAPATLQHQKTLKVG